MHLRLEGALVNGLSEMHYGFRKGLSTIDASGNCPLLWITAMVMVAKHFSDAKRICNEVWTCGVLL